MEMKDVELGGRKVCFVVDKPQKLIKFQNTSPQKELFTPDEDIEKVHYQITQR